MILRVGMADADLPSAWRGLRRSLQLAYRTEPLLLLVSFALIAGAALPDAFGALWLKQLADGVVATEASVVAWAAAGLAAAAVGGWLMRTIGVRVEMRFRDRATIELEAHVARLQATAASVEHLERPAYLDRLQLLRDQVFLLNHLYSSLMGQVASVARLVITVGLLMTIHPALAALVLFAIPSVVISSRRASVERAVQERRGPERRRFRHFFELGTSAGPAKEIRIGRIAPRLRERRRAVWDARYAELARARWASAAWHALGWLVFAAGYAGALAFVAIGLGGSPGDVLLALTAGAALSRYVGVTVGQAEFLRWTIDASQRLVWLEDYVGAQAEDAGATVPAALALGIRFERVSFTYPGTERLVLDDVDFDLPAGSVVALVGENGAGKTTLVKLLCGLYPPSAGRITVDGVDLAHVPAHGWRARLSGAFQDFFRFEYAAQRAIGVGDLPRLDDRPAAEVAVERAGAVDVVERLPRGLDTQLGPTWRDGVELSIGQWQKLALARGLMRERPLVCVFDEPTAALDAETEHALFERFAAQARAARADGRITVLVSHRFSTVRMADRIVVLDGARVVEVGSHAALVARGGLYAELYETQARAYR
jgi:ATP-binding cassette, subfamily B, bacterial